MKTQNTMSLTLPSGAGVVKPKPTKREILDALVKLRIERIHSANLAVKKKIDALRQEIEPQLKRWVVTNGAKLKPDVCFGYLCQSPQRLVSVSLKFDSLEKLLPEDLVELIKQTHQLQAQIERVPTEKDLREEIKFGLELGASPEERVGALLADKETRGQLDIILDRISK